jgi:LacI family transcriptional regulator
MATARARAVKLSDIARQADISVAAASMALANHPGISVGTKQRVRALSRKLGYRKPASRAGVRKSSRKVGLMLVRDELKDVNNSAILDYFMKIAAAHNVRLEVAAVREVNDRVAVLESILKFADGLDGLLLSGLVRPDDVEEVERAGVPCVVLGQMSGDAEHAHRKVGRIVSPDDIGAGRLGSRWLASRGHRRIAFVCEVTFPNLSHDRWLTGYRLGLLESGIVPEPSLVAITGQELVGAAPALDLFASRGVKPTAYVIPDVRIGHSLVDAIRARGGEIASDAIVLGGTPDAAKSYHVEHLPFIGPDITAMADISLYRVLHARQLPKSAMEIYVPIVTRNIS